MSVRGFNTGTGVERYDYNALDNVPLTTNTRVKGDAEVEYREGDVNLTKANIGLGNVDNTSDADKPISTAQQRALDDLSRQLSDKTTGLDTKAPVILETASGSIASFDDGADSMPIRKLMAQIEPVQSGTGDPSPDNVRPISGWAGAEIQQSGVNVWDEEWEEGQYNDAGNVVTAPAIRSKNYIPCLPNTSYYFCNLSNYGARVNFYNAEKSFISTATGSNRLYTTPENCYYMLFHTSTDYGTTYNHDISINHPATDTEYHPYAGNQISVTFPSEAGTVYGGTLYVTNGKLTVTMAEVDLGTLNWNRDTTTRPADGATIHAFFAAVNDCKITTSIPNMLSSIFKADTIKDVDYGGNTNIKDFICSGADGNYRIWVYGSIYNEMSTSEFKTAMSGVQLVYELATPIEITLTPTQIDTLLGTNNIWCDTGDVEVTYPADTKLYIDNKITQAIANALNS